MYILLVSACCLPAIKFNHATFSHNKYPAQPGVRVDSSCYYYFRYIHDETRARQKKDSSHQKKSRSMMSSVVLFLVYIYIRST